MNSTSASSGFPWAALALVAAVVALGLSAAALGEVRAVRAELEMLRASPATTTTTTTTPTPTPTTAPEPTSAEVDLSPWSALPPTPVVRIPRAALENVDELTRTARVVPAFEKGGQVGLKFFSIREDSLFWQIGLRNADVVVALNDLRIATPEQAMAVSEQLRSSATVKLSVRRRGQPVRIDIVIE